MDNTHTFQTWTRNVQSKHGPHTHMDNKQTWTTNKLQMDKNIQSKHGQQTNSKHGLQTNILNKGNIHTPTMDNKQSKQGQHAYSPNMDNMHTV